MVHVPALRVMQVDELIFLNLKVTLCHRKENVTAV